MNGPTLPAGVTPSSAPTTAPGGSPTPGPSTAPSSAPSSVAMLPLTFSLPTALVQSAARTPMSDRGPAAASTTTLTVTVTSINGSTTLPSNVQAVTNIVLTLGGNCTTSGAGETCTVTIPAPMGTVTYAFTITDSANTVIATMAVTTTNVPNQTSVAGGQQPEAKVVVKSVSLSLGGNVTPGTPATIPVAVTARDAHGNVITGGKAFARPIVIADGETTSATGLTLDGAPAAKSITVDSIYHIVALAYDGTAIPPFTLTASGDTFPSSTLQVTPGSGTIAIAGTTNDTYASTDPNYNQPTLFFDVTGKTRSFTASEPGWSDHGHGFTVTADPVTCGSGASSLVSVASTDQLTFNVTSAHYGLCKLTVADGLGTKTPVWASISTATIGVH